MEFSEIHEVKNMVDNRKTISPFDPFHKDKNIPLVLPSPLFDLNSDGALNNQKEEDLDDILNDIKKQDSANTQDDQSNNQINHEKGEKKTSFDESNR